MLDKKEFYTLLANKNCQSDSSLAEMKKCLSRYPYFEVLRFIYLKALYEKDYELFQEELKKTAVLITNREELFFFIFEEEFKGFNKNKSKAKKNKDQTSFLIDVFFENLGEEIDDVLEIDKQAEINLASIDYLAFLEQSEQSQGKRNDNTPPTQSNQTTSQHDEINQDAEDEDITKADIVPIENAYNIEDLYAMDDLIDESAVTPMKGQNLIDEFLAKEYTPLTKLNKKELKNDKDFAREDDTSIDDEDNEAFFTETLANIYIKQRRYEKAYKIIEHLSLNYPRKSIYFAEQLSFLEKLILNSKYNKK